MIRKFSLSSWSMRHEVILIILAFYLKLELAFFTIKYFRSCFIYEQFSFIMLNNRKTLTIFFLFAMTEKFPKLVYNHNYRLIIFYYFKYSVYQNYILNWLQNIEITHKLSAFPCIFYLTIPTTFLQLLFAIWNDIRRNIKAYKKYYPTIIISLNYFWKNTLNHHKNVQLWNGKWLTKK